MTVAYNNFTFYILNNHNSVIQKTINKAIPTLYKSIEFHIYIKLNNVHVLSQEKKSYLQNNCSW